MNQCLKILASPSARCWSWYWWHQLSVILFRLRFYYWFNFRFDQGLQCWDQLHCYQLVAVIKLDCWQELLPCRGCSRRNLMKVDRTYAFRTFLIWCSIIYQMTDCFCYFWLKFIFWACCLVRYFLGLSNVSCLFEIDLIVATSTITYLMLSISNFKKNLSFANLLVCLVCCDCFLHVSEVLQFVGISFLDFGLGGLELLHLYHLSRFSEMIWWPLKWSMTPLHTLVNFWSSRCLMVSVILSATTHKQLQPNPTSIYSTY